MKNRYKIYTMACICFLTISTTSAQSFEWAAKAGESLADVGHSVVVDPSGNVYTTGLFSGTVDFDPGVGTINLISAGDTDVFVSKLDASGNFVWAVNMGGLLFDGGNSITLDTSGNVYVTGFFQGSASFGSYNLVSAGNYDVFVSKLDSSGNFLAAIKMGGTLADFGNSIAVDVSGNIYTTGSFDGTADFDPDAVGVNNLISLGAYDIFVSKLDASGNFVWAKSMGSTGSDTGNSIDLDSSGDVYTTGSFEGTVDFDPGVGIQNRVSAGDSDIFISKLDASGNFATAKAMGGTNGDKGNFIAVDASDNVYSIGYFEGTADFDPGPGINNLVSQGGRDVYLFKFNPSNNSLDALGMGGTEDDEGNALAVNASGTIFITGSFNGTADFNPGVGIHNLTATAFNDMFIVKFGVGGNFLNAKSVGGNGNDFAYGAAIDISGNIFIVGSFQDIVDFNPGSGIFNLTSLGDFDIFVQKL